MGPTCLYIDEKTSTFIVPEGSQQVTGKDGDCIVVQPEIVHSNKVVRRAPQEICDIGIKQGKVCVQAERIPREEICPSGTQERDGNCITTSLVIMISPLIISKPVRLFGW